MRKHTLLLLLGLVFGITASSQDSNIRKYTPSKLLEKGQWDFKIFNNLYTENKGVDDNNNTSDFSRRYFFTTTFEVVHGVTESRRLNVGLIANLKSNVNNGMTEENGLGDVFAFANKDGVSRSGLTSLAPTLRYTPLKNVGNFSVQSTFYIPLIDHETIIDGETGIDIFLDRNSFIWENRIFYDRIVKEDFQLFLELDVNYQFGDSLSFEYDEESMNTVTEGGFANNSFVVPASVFFSWFPSDNFTLYAMTQHYTLIDAGNNFSQDFTQSGGGAKYQLTDELNIEFLYTNFWRGNSTGLGETFNLGLRYLMN